jgi:hypothetical protein
MYIFDELVAVGFNIPLSMAKKTVVFAIGKTALF